MTPGRGGGGRLLMWNLLLHHRRFLAVFGPPNSVITVSGPVQLLLGTPVTDMFCVSGHKCRNEAVNWSWMYASLVGKRAKRFRSSQRLQTETQSRWPARRKWGRPGLLSAGSSLQSHKHQKACRSMEKYWAMVQLETFFFFFPLRGELRYGSIW